MFRAVEPVYIHLYTAIQLVCLGCIWVVKVIKPTAAYFPFVIIAMVPLRMYALPELFDEPAHAKLDDDHDLSLQELKDRCTTCVRAAYKEFLAAVQGDSSLRSSGRVRAFLLHGLVWTSEQSDGNTNS